MVSLKFKTATERNERRNLFIRGIFFISIPRNYLGGNSVTVLLSPAPTDPDKSELKFVQRQDNLMCYDCIEDRALLYFGEHYRRRITG